MREILFVPTFRGWQKEARAALAAGWTPEEIVWSELGDDAPRLMMFEEGTSTNIPAAQFYVPRMFVEIATRVVCHRSKTRWDVLYRVLWRITQGERHLLEISVDSDVHQLLVLDKTIRRDLHKMRAFVRFRTVIKDGTTWYVAWFEPEHRIVALNAPFFRDRFAQMQWSILTPDECVHWEGDKLSFTPGVTVSEAPRDDTIEKLWLTYYASIFNPARVKTNAMQGEMPKKYWKNLPEAALIPTLLEEAAPRVETMIAKSRNQSANPPETRDLAALRIAAVSCMACPLCKLGTQTVFGEGPQDAEMVLVGEQPGDSEDLAGKPFVGPAGQLLNRALKEAGIDRSKTYVTNAVKHFKWAPRGNRRLHINPARAEVLACRPWLEAELRIVKPRVLVLLGGTAAQSVLGSVARVTRDRGRKLSSEFCDSAVVTIHPSALLRVADEEDRAVRYAEFVADLSVAKKLL